MKKKIVCVLLSFVLVLALIPTAFAVADVCTITVTVKDADETETLIAGAEVNLGNFSETTAPTGSCTLVVPQGTSGNLTVYKDGWVIFSTEITAQDTAGEILSREVFLTKNIWALTGTVTNEDGVPVPDAEVSWGRYETTSGPDGKYALDDLPAGTANFTVYAEGYVVYSEANMEVRHGMPEKNVALNFHTLSGEITDEDGNPVSGAEVNWGNYAAFTDDNGYYSMKVLAGTANLIAYKEGYVIYSYPAFTVSGAAAEEDIVLSLPPHTLEGTITDAAGNPVPGAEVNWGNYAAFTDDNGHYSMQVPAGTNSLTVYADGFLIFAEPGFAVANGTIEKNIVLEANLCTLAGTVTDANGKPVSGAEVNWGNYAAFTDDNGYYSMEVTGGIANLTVCIDGSAVYSEKDFAVGNGILNEKNIVLNTAANPAAPKTGDGTTALPYVFLAGASLAVLYLTLRKRHAYK